MLPRKTTWTDADFVPHEAPLPEYKEHRPRDEDQEKHEWYRQEIRARLAAHVTPNEIIGWLLSEGWDSTTITWLMVAATSDVPAPSPHLSSPPGLVISVDAREGSPVITPTVAPGGTLTQVHTDPVDSVRARVDARRARAAEEVHDAPAPEFGFAQPIDAAESWAAQHGPDMGNVLRAAILILAIVVTLVLGLIAVILFR